MKNVLKTLLVLSIVVIIILGVVYKINNAETEVINDAVRKNATGKFVALSSGTTHYDEGGADTAKTVILIHGYSVPAYIWNPVFDSLVKAGFHVVKYDEFGRGYSDRPDVDYTPEFYRKQLYDLIHALKLKTPVSLAGVSFGGAVVGDFAAHYPDLVDKLILVDPVYRFSLSVSNETIADFYMALDHEDRAHGQLDDFKYPDKFPNWVAQYKVQMQYKGFRHALISTNKNYPSEVILNNYKTLNTLHKKVLLIWGKEDNTVTFNFSDSLKSILDVRFLPVDDAGHLPYLERPAFVIPQIVGFLKE